MIIALIIALVLAVGGGVSVAAEHSLPGSPLYPIKINVNEEVREALTFSDEAKAEYESERAGRRLDESEQLATDGRLDAKTSSEAETNFQMRIDKVTQLIAQFQSKQDYRAAADVSANLETSLRAHDQILLGLAAANPESATPINSLEGKVRAEADDASKLRTDSEAKLSIATKTEVQAAAEAKLGAAENAMAEVSSFLDEEQVRLGGAATDPAQTQLKIAEQKITDGKAKLAAEDYGQAFITFQSAIQTAEQAKLLIAAKQNLNINVAIPPLPAPTLNLNGGLQINANLNL